MITTDKVSEIVMSKKSNQQLIKKSTALQFGFIYKQLAMLNEPSIH